MDDRLQIHGARGCEVGSWRKRLSNGWSGNAATGGKWPEGARRLCAGLPAARAAIGTISLHNEAQYPLCGVGPAYVIEIYI